MKKQLKLLATLLTMTALFAPASLLAQDELLQDSQSVLQTEQIDIEGEFAAEEVEEQTNEEIIQEARQKAEKKNVKKIAKKIENLSVPKQQVKQITKKEGASLSSNIATIFGQSQNQQEEQQQVIQKAPVQQVPVQQEVAPAPRVNENFKIIPTVGYLNINGDNLTLESKYNLGITAETMINNRFSVGLGLGYSTLDLTDYEVAAGGLYIKNKNDMKYDQLSIEVNGKVYLITEGNFKPYLGAALGFSRINLDFDGETSNQQTWGSVYQIDEEYNANLITGTLKAGAEYRFTKTFGVNVEASVSRALMDPIKTESVVHQTSGKQLRLDTLGDEIADSNMFNLNIGLLITF